MSERDNGTTAPSPQRGWKIVPTEPTRMMDYAGHDAFVDASSPRYKGSDPHREVWEAMLSACPPAEHAVVTADMVKAGSAYAARFVGNWFSDQHIRQLLEAALATATEGSGE